MTLGFRVYGRRSTVDSALVAAFAEVPVANVSDSMHRMSAGGARLRPIHPAGVHLSGPAITVRCRPGDNLLIHKAIDMAAKGDVIVVDGGGDLTNALIGEIMVYLAQERGISGFVLNGAVRDREEIYASGLPVYAAGVTHRGPYKDGPGEINATIAIDGMIICPGDLIIGDADGVLCVPQQEAEGILRAAKAKQAAEQAEIKSIRDGSVDRSWVDRLLDERGCEYVD